MGNLVMQTHKCCCGVLHVGICPYHTALSTLFAVVPGIELSKSGAVNIIRQVLSRHGVGLTRPGPDGLGEVQRFGGHVLRVAGAQFLTRLMVPLSTVMLLGRWGRQAIERYVQDAALNSFEILVSRVRSGGAPGDQCVAADKPAQGLPGCSSVADAAAIKELSKKVETLALSVDAMQDRPQFIDVVAKKALCRDVDEATKLPWQWRAKGCGWPYGTANFRRCANVEGMAQCKSCFASVAEPEKTESESESESDSASTSTEQED